MIKKDRKRAKAWMVLKNINNTDIKNALGLRYLTQVSETLSGVRDDKRVLLFLIKIGCPERYLALPEKIRASR